MRRGSLLAAAALWLAACTAALARHDAPAGRGAAAPAPDDGGSGVVLLISLHGDDSDASQKRPAVLRYRLRMPNSTGGVAAAARLSALDASGAFPQPRGMAALPDGSVLVACADNADSKLVRVPDPRCAVGACSPPRLWATAGLSHPYGVAVDVGSSRVLVSNQDSGAVSAVPYGGSGSYGGGNTSAFYAYGGKPGQVGLRGVAVDAAKRRVYVAAEGRDTVYVHDAGSGALLGAIAVHAPIAVTVEPSSGDLIIGCNDAARVVVRFMRGRMRANAHAATACALAAQAYRWRAGASGGGGIVQQFVCDGAVCGGHAAGVAVSPDGGYLLVLGQDAGVLAQFRLTDGAYMGTVLTGLKRPQQLLFEP